MKTTNEERAAELMDTAFFTNVNWLSTKECLKIGIERLDKILPKALDEAEARGREEARKEK